MNNADAAIEILKKRPVTAWELLQEVGTLGTKDAASQLLARLWQQQRLRRKKVPNMDPNKGVTSPREVYQYTLINDTDQQEQDFGKDAKIAELEAQIECQAATIRALTQHAPEQCGFTYVLTSVSAWPRYLSLDDAMTEAEQYMTREKGTDVMVCAIIKEAKRQVVWE